MAFVQNHTDVLTNFTTDQGLEKGPNAAFPSTPNGGDASYKRKSSPVVAYATGLLSVVQSHNNRFGPILLF